MFAIQHAVSLEHQLECISLEANVLSNLIGHIKTIFPALSEKFKVSQELTQSITDNEQTFKDYRLNKDQEFIIKELVNFKYIDISELSTMVPEGFHGDYLSYMEVLTRCLQRASLLNKEVMEPFYVLLSSFLTNKEEKSSLKDFTPIYEKLKQSRELLVKDLGQFFNSGHESKAKIGVVVKRNNDFKDVFSKVNYLKKTIDTVDIKGIKDSLAKTIELMDLIVKRVQENSISSVTPEVAKNLSYGAFEVASEVEFFSVIYFKMIVLDSCTDALALKLTNHIKGIPE